MKFKDVITSRDKFREIMGEASDKVTRKTLDRLDRHCGKFIAAAPFAILSTADGKGNIDVSPKGDPSGFVKILDERTLALPDRLGNRRADSIENILQNPEVGLIFLIPGKAETLRVSGTAQIVRDSDLRESLVVQGRAPDFVIAIHVKEAFFHCSKCMIRSKLWQAEAWPNLQGLPTLAQTMVDAGQLELTVDEMHEIVINDERTRLY
jgi:PPOX class probable FMN-dependent enzyme